MEPRYNEGPRDWQKLMCSLQRGSFTYIEALCHIALYFTITGVKKIVR